MSLRIANREFVPRLWAVLLTAALLAAFVAFGWWQLGRAGEKQAMIESFQRGAQSSVELKGDVAFDELPRYQHVRAAGRYEPERQVLIDNMPSQAGLPGYRVLTPLRREDSETAPAGGPWLGPARGNAAGPAQGARLTRFPRRVGSPRYAARPGRSRR